MLIRRRLSTLMELVKEYTLTVDVTLVPLTQNIADRLTQVPQRWFGAMKKENRPEPLISAAHVNELDASQIMAIHRCSGHLGVRRTTYFIRRICPTIAKAGVKSAIQMCEECQSIDLAQWEKGKLEVNRNWQRLGMDITHYSTYYFIMLMDCGPLRFSIWKQLARQDSASVIRQLPECTGGSDVWVSAMHNTTRAGVQDCWRRLFRKKKEYLPRDCSKCTNYNWYHCHLQVF